MSDLGQRDPAALDDVRHREELRDRFAMLLQELRVVLPGTQVLLAFLLTVPFSQRFADIGRGERVAYGVALVLTALAVVVLFTPVVLHRLGERTARADRLRYSVRLVTAGLVLVAAALVAAIWAVASFVFGTVAGVLTTVAVLAVLVFGWGLLPLRLRRSGGAEAVVDDERSG